MSKKKPKRKPETFSLHPLTVEEAITKALKADPAKVREQMAGLKRQQKNKSDESSH